MKLSEEATRLRGLPSDWERMRFVEFVELHRGYDLSVNQRIPGDIPVIGSNGVVGFHSEAKFKGPGVATGRSGTIGLSFYIDRPYWPLNTALYVSNFHSNCPLFVHFFFKQFAFSRYSAGVSVPTLNRNLVHVADVCVPRPPEQRKIAAVLAKIQRAVELQEAILTNVRELKKSLMHRLFTHGLRGEKLKPTEIGNLPQSWEVVKAGSLFKLTSGTTRPPQIAPTPTDDFVHPVFGGNGIMGYSDRYSVDEKALVIGRVGEYCGAVHVSPPKAWITDNALYSKQWLSSDVELEYLAAYLAFFDLNRLRMKSSQPLVTQGTVHSVDVPLPQRGEQEEIAESLRTLDEKLAVHESKKTALQDLFKTTLNQLMTGAVRVPDLDIDTSEVDA